MNEHEKYIALCEKNSEFDGAFYAAVKTTGIFCRTICTARKPKEENVQFFDTIQEALSAGYRPCKICRPMEGPKHIPEDILSLIREVEENPGFKLKQWQLRERGFDPNTLRRWFQKNYGMTFQAFCRMHRISHAFGALQDGQKVSISAMNSGYDSLSGFNSAFEKIMGNPPSVTKKFSASIITYKRFDSPLGPMIAAATDDGLCLLEFGDRRMLESELIDLQKRLNARILLGVNPHIVQVQNELNEYFEGNRTHFDVKLVTPGSDFQQNVWNALMNIPYGETVNYGHLARDIGNENAVRAVGRANGMNRIAILIPCHRVIGSNGELIGYGGGLWRKEWLLSHEKKHMAR